MKIFCAILISMVLVGCTNTELYIPGTEEVAEKICIKNGGVYKTYISTTEITYAEPNLVSTVTVICKDSQLTSTIRLEANFSERVYYDGAGFVRKDIRQVSSSSNVPLD